MKGVFFIWMICVFSSCQKERKKNYNHLYPELIGEWRWDRTFWYWEDEFGVHGRYVTNDSAQYNLSIKFYDNKKMELLKDGDVFFRSKVELMSYYETDSFPKIQEPPSKNIGIALKKSNSFNLRYYSETLIDTFVVNTFPMQRKGVNLSPFIEELPSLESSLSSVYFNDDDTYSFDRVDNYFVRVK